jgi:hypothetical protein
MPPSSGAGRCCNCPAVAYAQRTFERGDLRLGEERGPQQFARAPRINLRPVRLRGNQRRLRFRAHRQAEVRPFGCGFATQHVPAHVALVQALHHDDDGGAAGNAARADRLREPIDRGLALDVRLGFLRVVRVIDDDEVGVLTCPAPTNGRGNAPAAIRVLESRLLVLVGPEFNRPAVLIPPRFHQHAHLDGVARRQVLPVTRCQESLRGIRRPDPCGEEHAHDEALRRPRGDVHEQPRRLAPSDGFELLAQGIDVPIRHERHRLDDAPRLFDERPQMPTAMLRPDVVQRQRVKDISQGRHHQFTVSGVSSSSAARAASCATRSSGNCCSTERLSLTPMSPSSLSVFFGSP